MQQRSFAQRAGLYLLLPSLPIAVAIYPFLFCAALVPFLGFIVLPSILGLTCFLLYGTAWAVHILLPTSSIQLPLNPVRCFHIDRAVFAWLREAYRLKLPELALDWAYRRIMLLGSERGRNIVRENIPYTNAGRKGHRLDVYLALDIADRPAEDRVLRPVIVFLPGGGWSLCDKRYFSQVALQLSKLGYVTVIPNLTQFPQGKINNMCSDARQALSWTHANIAEYGGDSDQIFLMGYGSGSHIALLTVIQDAVVRSRDEYWLRLYEKGEDDQSSLFELSAGIRRLEIWGEDKCPLPPIQGLILLAGITDVIKHIRWEFKRKIDTVSPLRKALGTSHASCLMASPSHLIYGSKQILDTSKLPQKVLCIHGGADTEVPIVQTVLLKTLLVGVGVPARMRAYRDMSHMEAITSLMTRRGRYTELMASEIVSLIES